MYSKSTRTETCDNSCQPHPKAEPAITIADAHPRQPQKPRCPFNCNQPINSANEANKSAALSRKPNANSPFQSLNPITEATRSIDRSEKPPLDPCRTIQIDTVQQPDTVPEETIPNHVAKSARTIPNPSFRSRAFDPTKAFTSAKTNERSRLRRRWEEPNPTAPSKPPKRFAKNGLVRNFPVDFAASDQTHPPKRVSADRRRSFQNHSANDSPPATRRNGSQTKRGRRRGNRANVVDQSSDVATAQ